MPREQPKKHSERSENVTGCDRSPHVLLIEDDEEMLNMLSEALMQEGYRVTKCTETLDWLLSCIHCSGKDMSSSANNSFDVVISDIRLPKMGGLDALRIINDLDCAEICPPTIFITAFGDEETHSMARKLGAAEVLDKPFDINDLIRKVCELVST